MIWSENDLLLSEKEAFCERFLKCFCIVQSEISLCFPVGELKYSIPLSSGFSSIFNTR